jgi:hypothetical protein
MYALRPPPSSGIKAGRAVFSKTLIGKFQRRTVTTKELDWDKKGELERNGSKVCTPADFVNGSEQVGNESSY